MAARNRNGIGPPRRFLDVWFEWKELAWALSATLVISILWFGLLLSLVRHVPSFELLRKEA
jgi:hypothetical protein